MSLGRAVSVWCDISATEMSSLTQLHWQRCSLTAGDKHFLPGLSSWGCVTRLGTGWKSGCLILVNKEHLLPVGALRIPPYFLSTLGFLIQFITILEEMGTNREPFPKKSCFQNVTHRCMGLISSLKYCSPDGIYRDLLTHPQSPHTDQTRSWVLGVPMWLQPKQVPNSLTRQPDVIKKILQKGWGSRERTDLWRTWLSLILHTFIMNLLLQNTQRLQKSMLYVVNTWFPEESEKSESNCRVDETDDSHMPEKSWSNQRFFFF